MAPATRAECAYRGWGRACLTASNEWATRGLSMSLQYDIIRRFHALDGIRREAGCPWLRTAPHCYGNAYGIYASGHCQPRCGTSNLWNMTTSQSKEWMYQAIESKTEIHIPATPGFGIVFDDELVTNLIKRSGWS